MSEPFQGVDRKAGPPWGKPKEPTKEQIAEWLKPRPPRDLVCFISPSEFRYLQEIGAIGPNGEIL